MSIVIARCRFGALFALPLGRPLPLGILLALAFTAVGRFAPTFGSRGGGCNRCSIILTALLPP